MTIEEKREQVGYYLAAITGAKHRATSFQSTEDDLKRLKTIDIAVEKITELTKDASSEELQEILGGEFTKDYLHGQPFDTGKVEIPAYFLLDVAAGVIDKQCSQVADISKPTKETLDKLKGLRDRAVELDFNPLFSPDKHVPKDFIETLSKMGNDYSLDVKTAEGVKYLELRIDSQREDVEHKNGEYHSLGVYHSNSEKPLYTEDAAVIEAKKEEKIQERLEKLNKIAEKYFRDGVIPKSAEFQECLLDPNADRRIVNLLKSISDKRSESYDVRDIVESDISYRNVERVSYVEETIEKERIEEQRRNEEIAAREAQEREAAITQARERYKAKSPLWKVFHGKQNIDKMELSAMTTEQISSLYTNNSSSRKK